MSKIFFSYRRMDSRDETLQLWRMFAKKFGILNRPFDSYLPRKRLFIDIETMDYTEGDFRKQIQRFIILCDVVLVVIGPKWLPELKRRMKTGEQDWVRVEVEFALLHEKRVIPVLINGATMPPRDELPEDMRQLTMKHAATIRPDRVDEDMNDLAKRLHPARDYQLLQYAMVLLIMVAIGLGIASQIVPSEPETPQPNSEVVTTVPPTNTTTPSLTPTLSVTDIYATGQAEFLLSQTAEYITPTITPTPPLSEQDIKRIAYDDMREELTQSAATQNANPLVSWVATSSVRIRSAPSSSAEQLGILDRGSVIEVDLSTRTEADGFIWYQHARGWSAQSTTAGEIFLVELTDTVITEDVTLLSADSFPLHGELFQQLPISIDDVQWMQYFGNTVFAYRNGKSWGYDNYAQGLHGGIDFGNSEEDLSIVAGVPCTVIVARMRNNTADVRCAVDDNYVVHYMNFANITVQEGDELTPDSIIGSTQAGSTSRNNVHFEVRYQNKWIINPLWLMPDEMVQQITEKFDPSNPSYFYQSDDWQQWITPLDQPVIELAGELIGPRA